MNSKRARMIRKTAYEWWHHKVNGPQLRAGHHDFHEFYNTLKKNWKEFLKQGRPRTNPKGRVMRMSETIVEKEKKDDER